MHCSKTQGLQGDRNCITGMRLGFEKIPENFSFFQIIIFLFNTRLPAQSTMAHQL